MRPSIRWFICFYALGFALAAGTSCRLRSESTVKTIAEPTASFGDCQVGQGYYGEMRVCVDAEGIAADRVSLFKAWLQQSLGKWSEPLNQVDGSAKLNIVYSCQEPHLTVFVMPAQGRGFAGCGVIQFYENWPAENAASADQQHAAEILHLTGIAAAAQTATYEEYGVCLSDQPLSVMCMAGQSKQRDEKNQPDLYSIDRDNVQSAFRSWVAAGKPVPPRE